VHHRWLSIALLAAVGRTALADDDPCAEAPGDPCAEAPGDPCAGAPDAGPVAPAVVNGTVQVHGNVRSKRSSEPLAGATVIATRSGSDTSEPAITDETGSYTLALSPGTYEVTIYYLDATFVLPKLEVADVDIERGTTWITEQPQADHGFDFLWEPGPELTSVPRFGLTVAHGRSPVSRDRTHRDWIAPAASADPRTAVTTLEGAARLQRAPGIPTAFLDEVATYTLRVPIDAAMGTGGASTVSLRSGSNETHGDARVLFELARDAAATTAGGAELVAAGPLVHDKAWLAAGLVAHYAGDGTLGASGMLRINYAQSAEHQLSVIGLAQAPDPRTRDGWSGLRWISKFDDNKLTLDGTASAEQLELTPDAAAGAIGPSSDLTNRVAAQAGLTWRKRASGYHQLRLVAGGGSGFRRRARHDEVSLAAGDTWQVKPNVELELGVRSDTRLFDGDRATVTSPRLAVTWDASKEGRSDVFVAYQRVPHLDDGMPGDWRVGESRFHDEIATGASYERSSGWPIMVGVAGRARSRQHELEDKLGVEGWARVEGRRTLLHASATTLGRVATVMAQRTAVKRRKNTLVVGAMLRASPETTTGGAAVTWKHAGRRSEKPDDLSFDLAAEGYTSEAGPALRILLGGAW